MKRSPLHRFFDRGRQFVLRWLQGDYLSFPTPSSTVKPLADNDEAEVPAITEPAPLKKFEILMSEASYQELSQRGEGDISLGLQTVLSQILDSGKKKVKKKAVSLSESTPPLTHWWAAVMENDVHAASKILSTEGLSVDLHVDSKNESGKSALHIASEVGHVEMVRWLLDRSASIDIQCEEENTPLHYAAYHNSIEVVRVLLDAGANVWSKNIDRHQPWSCAMLSKHLEVMRLIAARISPDRFSELEFSILLNRVNNSNLSTFDLNAKDAAKFPLHEACLSGNEALVIDLLMKGYDCNEKINKVRQVSRSKIKENDRPLHVAALGGHANICRILLEHGAFPNALDLQCRPPLHIAVTNKSEATVKMLLEGDADILFRDGLNRPLSEVAKSVKADPEFIAYLQKEEAEALKAALSSTLPQTSSVSEGEPSRQRARM